MVKKFRCAHCGEVGEFDTNKVRMSGSLMEHDGDKTEPSEYLPECLKCGKRTAIPIPKGKP